MKHTTFGTSFRGKTAHYARLDDLLDFCNEFFFALFMETVTPSRCRSWDITGRHTSKTTSTVV